MARNRQQQQQKQAKKPKPKKAVGIKKFVLVAVMGVVFGLFAAGAYIGVVYPASKMIKPEQGVTEQVAVTSSDVIAEIEKSIQDLQKNGINDSSYENEANTVTAVVSDVSDVVERVMPSVVSIYGEFRVESYFGPSIEPGSGSGIIIGKNDEEILIVTNYHVVQDSRSLSVSFINGEEADAYIKGKDEYNDLAVIAVLLEDLDAQTQSAISYAKLGDSDDLKVGEPTIAIGNALGYGQSVTTGIISAIQRDILVGEDQTRSMIQTDAAINPGNSGGALLNIKGEVIGINELKKTGGGVIEGMGYAIPITFAKPIIDELSTKTTIPESQRGYLGIFGVSVKEADAQNFNLPVGVYITQVAEDCAAADAGLRRGDVITAIDGEEIRDFEKLQQELSSHKIGDVIKVEVAQSGDVNIIELTLGARPK